jgi:toxin YoeB
VLRKINELIQECRRTPFSGRGKPEPPKTDAGLLIAQCRYHYE